MNEALRQYRIGLMTEQELFAELEKCYENDTDQYIQSLIEKSRKDEEFFNSLKINYPEIFNQLSENCYSVDVKNWTSMENAKLSITSSLKEKLQKIWSSYFASLSKTFGAYGDILKMLLKLQNVCSVFLFTTRINTGFFLKKYLPLYEREGLKQLITKNLNERNDYLWQQPTTTP